MESSRKDISIHAPRTGSDWHSRPCNAPRRISIHAPRTGSDPRVYPPPLPRRYFNPRSPYGERPAICRRFSTGASFQSTLPVRGATALQTVPVTVPGISIHAPRTGSDKAMQFNSAEAEFQSTLPVRGATCAASPPCRRSWHFNPRSPYGERLEVVRVADVRLKISIHAPRTGSD